MAVPAGGEAFLPELARDRRRHLTTPMDNSAPALTSERAAGFAENQRSSRWFVAKHQTKALDSSTWPDFARLVEANNGVWGGCWCMWYHAKDGRADDFPASRRKAKERLVREGRAHASLVFHGTDCVGWCQFGSPEELPRIHNQRAYLATNPTLPDWRITCFFSGKGYRGDGVASAALEGAVERIKRLGGGRIEGYPEDIEGRKASPAFLFNGHCPCSNDTVSSGRG